MATIFERIRKVTVEQLGVSEEEVTPSSSFVDDLGADSLDLVELIMALEEEFTTPARKVSIPDEDAEKIITVQDAMDYIRDLGVSDTEAPAVKAAEKAAPKPIPPRPAAGVKPGRQTTNQRPAQARPAQPQRGAQGGKSGGNRPAGQRQAQKQGQGQTQRKPQSPPKASGGNAS